MKETLNVNIGTQAFTIDDDAYTALKSYLDDIRSRLSEQDVEAMSDIELRLAEIFREKVTTSMRVITLDQTHAAMQQLGSPADFGECRNLNAEAPAQTAPVRPKLYRSRTNRSIAGICGGLSEYFDADPTMIRLLTLLLILLGGLSLWVYIVLWIVIPQEPARDFAPRFNARNTKK